MDAMKYDKDTPSCFKAYDIRGKMPEEIHPDFAYAIGKACAAVFRPESAVIGFDARLSGPELSAALAAGLAEEGIAVTNTGLCGTEEIYYITAQHAFDLGIMITGSHNPAGENGFKIVRAGALPVGENNGLAELARKCADITGMQEKSCNETGRSYRTDYINWLVNYVNFPDTGKRLKVLANAGNGTAGLVLKDLAERVPVEFLPLNYEPDGNFPNGVPNPLLPELRRETASAVINTGADLGVAFDGDFDRCFFYDHKGNFIESYYIVGLLARELLSHNPGEKIIHDPRLYWNTREIVKECGGVPVMGKTGHAFMKEKMRSENALYGGEMSAHHYFRDFAYCDSGILTMLLVLAFVQKSPKTLAELLSEAMTAYPCSGEINFRTLDTARTLSMVRKRYEKPALCLDTLDGLNIEFAEWRFSLRASNTEAFIRLNVESRGDRGLVEDKVHEISEIIKTLE